MAWRLAGGANRSGTDVEPAGRRVAGHSPPCEAAPWPRKPAAKPRKRAFSVRNLQQKCMPVFIVECYTLAQNLNGLLS